MLRYGFDPATPIESRIGKAPPEIVRMFAEGGDPAPTDHALTEADRKALTETVAALPPLIRRVFAGHLRSISFLDGLPNNALTSTVNVDAPYKLYDIVFRAGVLNETVSELLTKK